MNAAPGARPAADAVHVRRATPDDVPALLRLERYFPGDRIGARALRRFVRSATADVWVAVAGPDGDVVGDAVVLYRRGVAAARLYSIVVDPAERGRGVANALLEQAEAVAAERGSVAMRLEVRVDNDAARRLYERRGFEVVGTTDGYYEDGSSALRMRKRFVPGTVHLRTVPYYPQSLDFTCGAAALMMAMRAMGWQTPFSQAEEVEIWREATTVFMLSGHGGTSAHGLALAAHRRGVRARVVVGDADVPFLDSVRSAEKKTVIEIVHRTFAAALAEVPGSVTVGDFGDAEVVEALRSGAVPVLLVSGWRFHAEKVPHWVVATGWDRDHVYVHDPLVAVGTERADALHLPIARRDLAALARYGRARHRAMVVVGPGLQAVRPSKAASPSTR